MCQTLLAIDPGTMKSGYVILDIDTYRPLQFGKVDNEEILKIIDSCDTQNTKVVFEKFAPQSQTGSTTIDAIVWYGRMIERVEMHGMRHYHIYRRDVKKHLLGKFSKANGSADSQIRKALVKRFAQFDFVNGKGNKNNPDWFYGFSTTDCYAACATGVTWIDLNKNEEK